MAKQIPQMISLNNGVKMPQIGLGTWQMKVGQEAETAVRTGLEVGYRLIDTAAVYGNETSVGKAINTSGIARKDIFVTTKLWNSDQGQKTLSGFKKSLKRLGLAYIDLYVIHWPAPAADKYSQTWHILEQLYREKYVRAIGVSNFNVSHLEKLLAQSKITPAVNQIEIHPYFQNRQTVDFCRGHNIQIEAYSPLGSGSDLLQEPLLKIIAKKHNVSTAQVVLRWHLQNGFVVIPKARSKQHLQANLAIHGFKLDKDDIKQIDSLEKNEKRTPDPDTFNSGINTGIVQLAHRFRLVHARKQKK